MKTINELLKEIDLLVTYGAPEDQVEEAKPIIELYKTDRIALNVFHHFYSYLPEGLNDRITALSLLDIKEGTFLIMARTPQDDYCYIVSAENAEFLGNFVEGIYDQEVLKYFKITTLHYKEKYKEAEKVPSYQSLEESKNHCMACATKTGDYHRPGCPVEQCPWCDAQLIHCDCRFVKLGVPRITTQKQLDKFLEMLNKKGRVPFDLSQQPGRGRK